MSICPLCPTLLTVRHRIDILHASQDVDTIVFRLMDDIEQRRTRFPHSTPNMTRCSLAAILQWVVKHSLHHSGCHVAASGINMYLPCLLVWMSDFDFFMPFGNEFQFDNSSIYCLEAGRVFWRPCYAFDASLVLVLCRISAAGI